MLTRLERVTEVESNGWSQSFVLPNSNIVRYGWMFFILRL